MEELLFEIIDENKLVYGSDFEVITVFSLSKTKYYLDSKIIRHIISNVLSNAIKYSGSSRKIQINVTDEEGEIYINVIDFGIGIPDEDQKFMFEPFHRASNVEAIQGTGFGLSIVKRFVDLHSGKIEIESKTGKGTSVKIKLPILKNQKTI